MSAQISCIRMMSAAAMALLGIVASSATTGARANIVQPYCLSGGGGLSDHCDFATYAQCQVAATGFGVCSPNPNYAPPASQPIERKRR